MGERKGQNLYYPPDYDPKVGGLNKFLGTHALRERARKLHMGILIIRFEMPYNIWCDGCNNHIGMGVRYNAEKKKVGMYYSTPVYQFRMKCHLCDNHFEIKTDPGVSMSTLFLHLLVPGFCLPATNNNQTARFGALLKQNTTYDRKKLLGEVA